MEITAHLERHTNSDSRTFLCNYTNHTSAHIMTHSEGIYIFLGGFIEVIKKVQPHL